MRQSDWSVGEVLKALDDNGFRNNSLVIFSSDNGPEHYAYDRVRNHDHRSMGPLRGLKRDIWEGGHRVPFVIRWPGVVKAGTVSNELVSQIDLMATIAAAIGFTLPDNAGEDSYDLLPLWKGENRQPMRTTMVHNTNARLSVRDGDWTLIDAPSGEVSKSPEWYEEQLGYVANDGPTALYNLRDDLSQHINLSKDNPDRVATMKNLLNSIRAQGHSAPRLAK